MEPFDYRHNKSDIKMMMMSMMMMMMMEHFDYRHKKSDIKIYFLTVSPQQKSRGLRSPAVSSETTAPCCHVITDFLFYGFLREVWGQTAITSETTAPCYHE